MKDIADADLKRFPVENVSWDDCQEFIARVNERSKESGLGVPLAEGGGMGVCLPGRAAGRQESIARSIFTWTSRRISCSRTRRTSIREG